MLLTSRSPRRKCHLGKSHRGRIQYLKILNSSWKKGAWPQPHTCSTHTHRFMFLDIEDEPSKNGSTPPIAPDSTTHHDSSPNSSPTVKSTSTGTNHTHHNPSPLLTTHLSGSLPKTDTVSQESSENESNSDTDVNITN